MDRQCRETIIALKARSKAFRVAMDFLNPSMDVINPNDIRCECGGELRLIDEERGELQCMKCQKLVAVPVEYTDYQLGERAYVRPVTPVERVLTWILLITIVMGLIGMCLYALFESQPGYPPLQAPAPPATAEGQP